MQKPSKRQSAIIHFIEAHPDAATRHVHEFIAVRFDRASRSSTARDLAQLVETGFLYRTGSGRSATYHVEDRRGLKWVAGEKTPDKVYITRVFNFGTWQEWKEMLAKYPRAQIEAVLQQPLSGSWTKRGRALAQAVYGITLA